VFRVHKVQKGQLVIQEHQVQLDRQDLKVLEELPEIQERKVQQVLVELKAQLELQEHQAQ
jgi:hypothetical protein